MTRAARVERAVETVVEERVVGMAVVAVRVAAALAVAARLGGTGRRQRWRLGWWWFGGW